MRIIVDYVCLLLAQFVTPKLLDADLAAGVLQAPSFLVVFSATQCHNVLTSHPADNKTKRCWCNGLNLRQCGRLAVINALPQLLLHSASGRWTTEIYIYMPIYNRDCTELIARRNGLENFVDLCESAPRHVGKLLMQINNAVQCRALRAAHH